jgi:serine phosphatase RsbU (regulator of sigma subunit)
MPGDIFLAFTDGVPDCKNPSGEFFGRARVLDILKISHTSAEGLVKTIENELRQFITGETQFDDVTLLAVRRA